MSSTSVVVLDRPSQLYDAIKDTIEQALKDSGVVVGGYSDWGPETGTDRQILIEFGPMVEGQQENDGRQAQDFEIVLYSVFSRGQKNASLQAMNLASGLARLVKHQRWGLQRLVQDPENIGAEPSFLTASSDASPGFDAWECRFNQRLLLGSDQWPEEESRSIIAVAINPEDPDDDSEYTDIVIDVSGNNGGSP